MMEIYLLVRSDKLDSSEWKKISNIKNERFKIVQSTNERRKENERNKKRIRPKNDTSAK